jgi:hypothetical protein
MMMGINGVLPAQVIKYDRNNNRVQVQVLINTVGTSGEQVDGVQIASIPVYLMGGGGFMINFPLNEGDFGWVMACDRDISIFLQKYSAAGPAVETIKDFSSSFFLPDIMTNFSINGEDESSLVIQSADGSTKVSISDGKIKVQAAQVEIVGATEITGNVYVLGNIEASGSITPDVPPI